MKTLDPEVAEYLRQATMQDAAELHTLSPAAARKAYSASKIIPDNLCAPMYAIVDRKVDTDDAEIPIRIYYPQHKQQLPALLWFHGGGWVIGDLDTTHLVCCDLAALAECVVISVDYRLAPEFPFPAAFNDCVAATRWAFDHASELSIDPASIAVGGDSAGANLAACTAISMRDNNPALKHQLLIYPVIEANFETPSYSNYSEGYGLSRTAMQWFWDQYASEAMRQDSRVSPLNADLTNLPPAWLLTAGCDPLRDEGIKYAHALKAAGNDVSTVEYEDNIHGFFGMTFNSSEMARRAAASALAAALRA